MPKGNSDKQTPFQCSQGLQNLFSRSFHERLNCLLVIDSSVFYERLGRFCSVCPHWRGVCLKGHALALPEGCPLRLFPPVEGADYAAGHQDSPGAPPLRECCGADSVMPPLTWTQVFISFTRSMAKWVAAGLPLVSREVHGERYAKCKSCTEFYGFYCKHCRCIALLKTKLGGDEQCPLPEPRWFSANGQAGK